jgi:hypothetical protein
MAAMEDAARRRGCRAAWLDTFSFQAPGFYRGLGYRVFGKLAGYPPGHTRHFLWKPLDLAGAFPTPCCIPRYRRVVIPPAGRCAPGLTCENCEVRPLRPGHPQGGKS